MADKELRVHLKADDDISKTAKSARSELDRIPDKVSTTLDVDSSGLDDLTSKLGDLPTSLGDVAGLLSGGGGIAAGVGAAAVAAYDLAQGFADAAIEARVTADLTGASIEDASRLQAVWKQSGADINDLNDVLLQMNGVLQTSPELAKKIGVNLSDGADVGSRFVQVIGKIQNSTLGAAEKAQLMSQMFGEEGVRQVAKLTASIDGPLSDAIDDVSDAQIIDEDEERRAKDLATQTRKLNTEWQNLKMTLGEALVGPLAEEMGRKLAEWEAIKGVFSGDFWGSVFDVDGPNHFRAALDPAVDNLKNYREQVAAAADDSSVFGDALKAVGAGAAEGATGFGNLGSAMADAAAGAADGADALDELSDAMQANVDLRRSMADSEFAYRDAQRDFTKAIDETTKALQDSGPATLDGAAALDDFALSAGKAADSAVQLEIDQKAAAGATLTAAESQATWNKSMLTSARTTSGPLQQSIVNYIATANGIPPEKVTEILADPDYATIEAANAAIDKAAADETARIIAEAQTAQAARDLDAVANRKRTAYITAVVSGIAGGFSGGAGGGAAPGTGMAPAAAAAGMSTYAVAPAAAPTGLPPIVVNVPAALPTTIKVEAGVIGNRFDTQRTLAKALRAHQRLNGRRE